MGKKLVLITVGALLLAAVGVYIARNKLVAGAIESGGNAALRVETELRSVSLELGAGSLELRNYRISNPKGFSAVDFMTISRGKIALNTGSILDDEVVIDSLILEGLELNLEQIDSRGNFSELMKNIAELEDNEESHSEKRVKISAVYVKDLAVNASLVAFGQNRASNSVHIKELTLSDIGGQEGESVAGVIGDVVTRILEKSIAESRGSLPGGFGATPGEAKQDIIKRAGESVKKLGNSLLGK